VPLAQRIDIAKERPEQYECYDWWFCHKEGSKEDAEEIRKFLRRIAGVQ